jgi:Fe-S-cluster containining protein
MRKFHMGIPKAVSSFAADHPLGGHRYMLKHSQPCEFYGDGCKIYESRPMVCRMFPFLAGVETLHKVPDIFGTDMDTAAIIEALVKSTGLSATEIWGHLRYIGAWVED